MKLNHDCIRSVMLTLEKELTIDDDMHMNGISVEKLWELLPKYSNQDILYTVEKLSEGGYITASIQVSSGTFIDGCVVSITYAVHEFIENVRDSRLWASVKSVLGKAGAITLPYIIQAAAEIIGTRIKTIQ